MPQINLTMEEHQQLTKLVARSYDNNYRSDQFDTDTYDSMADKVYGLVCVPVYSNVGISTARKVEAVVDTIFNKGEAATSIVTR